MNRHLFRIYCAGRKTCQPYAVLNNNDIMKYDALFYRIGRHRVSFRTILVLQAKGFPMWAPYKIRTAHFCSIKCSFNSRFQAVTMTNKV